MKEKYKTLFIDGILFLLPVILILFLLNFFLGIIMSIVVPIEKILPRGAVFGMGMTNLTAIIILIILIFLCGYITRSAVGRSFRRKLEGIVSKIIPGFSILKEFFSKEKRYFTDDKIKAGLALIDDAWLFAFILEEANDVGLLTVFVPSAPIPTSGNVYLMTEQQIKRLDITVKEAISCITQFGIGSGKVLAGKIKLDPEPKV